MTPFTPYMRPPEGGPAGTRQSHARRWLCQCASVTPASSTTIANATCTTNGHPDGHQRDTPSPPTTPSTATDPTLSVSFTTACTTSRHRSPCDEFQPRSYGAIRSARNDHPIAPTMIVSTAAGSPPRKSTQTAAPPAPPTITGTYPSCSNRRILHHYDAEPTRRV